MFIDTSALIAILDGEPEAADLALAIQEAQIKIISGLVRLETVMALTRIDRANPQRNLQAMNLFVTSAGIECVPINEEISDLAIQAFAKYGKGRGHPAQLNLSDCMSYATAKHYGQPLLFKGNDFPHTDAVMVSLRN